jgi:hypothetical protein
VVGRAQALALGVGPAQVRAQVRRGVWRHVAPGVLGFPGHPDSLRRRCWIAVLHAGDGAAISHRSAATLLSMHPLDRDPAADGRAAPIELIVPRSSSRALPGTRRHRPRSFDPGQVEQVDGLPVTSPVRTVLDLSSVLFVPRLARVVENCEVDGICSVVAVGAELARVRRPGLAGVRRLEQVLDHLGPGEGLPHSELERLGDCVRRLAGLPEPLHEHPLPSARGRLGFVDRAWPAAMMIVEYDGRRWHTRRAEIDRDHRRDLEASALGWHPLRLTWEQLRHDPEGTAELWRATYDRRIALLRDRAVS